MVYFSMGDFRFDGESTRVFDLFWLVFSGDCDPCLIGTTILFALALALGIWVIFFLVFLYHSLAHSRRCDGDTIRFILLGEFLIP
jgi:hypothetical protein